jgi:archaeosine synthase
MTGSAKDQYGPHGTQNGILIKDPPFFLPEFEDAFRFIISTYNPPKREIAIFLPCALRKPYSRSPSHRLFQKVIDSQLHPDTYHIVVFGTCGVVPRELELMYPFAHYHYMLGKCTDRNIREAFLEIETYRLSMYLEKTKDMYKKRVAYCIGLFREAMCRASQKTGVMLDLLLPSASALEKNRDPDCPFPEGSLSLQAYLEEFGKGLALLSKGR